MTGLADATTLRTLTSLAISAGFTLLVALLALLFSRHWQGLFLALETVLSHFARRKGLASVVVFVAVIALRLAVLPLLHVPIPGIHDEFSYLLLGDTLAHGRLANPTHPLWVSFETFHVNWQPTYASMYPPAQGVALAVGQILGDPWIGVLLSDAAMCAVMVWMLQGWLPARWAFLGGALVALKFGVASYWMNSYWGGAVAATGGALVLGALPRIKKRPAVRYALAAGVGIAILANSRPYEGALFCAPSATWLLWWLGSESKLRVPLVTRLGKVAIPLCLMLAVTAGAMGYYNWRVTGNPLLLPHVLNTRTYHTAPLFLWERSKAPMHYRNAQFEDFYNGWERNNYEGDWAGVARVSWEKLFRCGVTYFWPGLLLALPALPFALRDGKMRLPLVSVILALLGVGVVIWSNAHYAAPMTCAIYLLIVQTMRHLRTMRIGARPVGLALSRAIVLLLILDTGINVGRRVCDTLIWPCEGDVSRQAIADKLAATPGKHLVVVRYDPGPDIHNIHDEWVFNGAEIDSAKVLWARELGAEQTAKLFLYFRDRTIWLVTPDTDNTYLQTYRPPGQ
jgi:hypothetical protein